MPVARGVKNTSNRLGFPPALVVDLSSEQIFSQIALAVKKIKLHNGGHSNCEK